MQAAGKAAPSLEALKLWWLQLAVADGTIAARCANKASADEPAHLVRFLNSSTCLARNISTSSTGEAAVFLI